MAKMFISKNCKTRISYWSEFGREHVDQIDYRLDIKLTFYNRVYFFFCMYVFPIYIDLASFSIYVVD